jgi:hypothetical protein
MSSLGHIKTPFHFSPTFFPFLSQIQSLLKAFSEVSLQRKTAYVAMQTNMEAALLLRAQAFSRPFPASFELFPHFFYNFYIYAFSNLSHTFEQISCSVKFYQCMRLIDYHTITG